MLKFVERALLRFVETVSLALLVILALSVLYSTTMRYLGASPSWYDEIASVLLAWLTYFGATYAVLLRQHMSFAGLVTALPRTLSIAVALFGELLVLAYFAITGWFGYKVLAVAAYDALLSLPWLSLDIVQSVIPITSVLMIIGTLLTMPRAIRDAAEGRDREHDEIDQAIADAEAGAQSYTTKEHRA
ncbi:TRAP transporter small permease [Tropicimonas isoalkanivorans]|uniref:TRAP transporter small permease protein n=1 Tax=Tropicimonas isoalkanivorans TaxID=441112 RepID=A0A1I1ML57_9RHOB|nr:TRAP transporter small permease [Tropicimonas isoalkanivorans]SFC85562.1 TRAP-type C4-dicarboxylate transport system, small permease component [Tropicimonas isoalkanivorans]